MRIALVVSGSRGDVQPMLALALGLNRGGHDAIFLSPPENEGLARAHDCPFRAVGSDIRGDVELAGGGLRALDRFIRRQVSIQIRGLSGLVEDRDLILASGLVFGVRPVAEHLGIPYRFVAFSPAAMLGTTRDGLATRTLAAVSGFIADRLYGAALNRGRASLGLPRVRNVMVQLIGRDPIAATDPALTVVPAGARLKATQTGYMHLPPLGELSDELSRFLDAGPPPVYAGFGSMPVGNSERISRLLVDAASATGQRLVVSRGWAELPAVTGADHCLFVGDEPHALLFPRVAAVIHHGGAGTIATAARAGVPQIVLPQAVDQFAWRKQVVALGLGPKAPLLRTVSAAALARAIDRALADGIYRTRAAELAARLAAAGDGVDATVRAVTEAPAHDGERDRR
jgi:vancomycin aglycone glucosyltransferase